MEKSTNSSVVRPVKLIDTTLRDGQQGTGFYLTYIQKCRIMRGLSNVNVTQYEIPSHDVGQMRRIVAFSRKLPGQVRIIAWCRLDWAEIRQAALSGCQEINISVPASRLMQEAKAGLDAENVALTLGSIGQWLGKRNIPWALGLEDASRSTEGELFALANLAMKAGAKRIRYADTLGILDPWELEARLKPLVDNFPLEWEFHGHDDRGLVLANAMAALRAGVTCLSATLGGVGERAGNLKTEDAAVLINQFGKGGNRFSAERLAGLSARVLAWAGRPCSDWRPYFGKALHRHESGIHVAALLKDTRTYDPWLKAGQSPEFWPGPNSGRKAIVETARILGHQIDQEQAGKAKEYMAHLFNRYEGLDVWKVFNQAVEWVSGSGRVG